MGYTKQNFIKGQILKADHLNAMETGIEANDLAVATLSEDLNGLKSNPLIYFSIYSRGYVCTHTYAELQNLSDRLLNVVYYDTQITVSNEMSKGNYMRAIYARVNLNPDDGTEYIEFTFLNHDRNGYDIFRVNSDNTVTLVSN